MKPRKTNVIKILFQIVALFVLLAFFQYPTTIQPTASTESFAKISHNSISNPLQSQVIAFTVGLEIERELKGKKKYSHLFSLKKGETCFIEILQKGIDVVVNVSLNSEPTTFIIKEFSSPNAGAGSELIKFVANMDGIYSFEIENSYDASGKYKLIIRDPNSITKEELLKIEAQKIFETASQKQDKDEEKVKLLQKALNIYLDLGVNAYKEVIITASHLTAAYYGVGKYPEAIEAQEIGLQTSTLLGDKDDMATAHLNIGAAYGQLRKREKLIEHHKKALVLFSEIGKDEGIALAADSLGAAHRGIRKYKEAIGFYEKCLDARKRQDNTIGIGVANTGIAISYAQSGEPKKAIEFYEKASALFLKADAYLESAVTANSLGNIYRGISEYNKAIEFYEKAIEFYEKVTKSRKNQNDNTGITGVAQANINIGLASVQSGDSKKAITFYKKALENRSLINQTLVVSVLIRLGDAETEVGEKTALDHLNEALEKSSNLSDKGRIENSLGRYFENAGQVEEALKHYETSLSFRRKENKDEPNVLPNTANVLTNIARMYDQKLEREKAFNSLTEAENILNDLPNELRLKLLIHNEFGRHYIHWGNYKEAEKILLEGLELAKNIDFPAIKGGILHNLGIVYNTLFKKDKALDFYKQALDLYNLEDIEQKQVQQEEVKANVLLSAIFDHKNGRLIDPNEKSEIYNSIAVLFMSLNDFQSARYCLIVAKELIINNNLRLSRIYNNIGHCYFNLGCLECIVQAIDNLEKAKKLNLNTGGDKRSLAATFTNLFFYYGANGEVEKSLENYDKTITLWDDIASTYDKTDKINSNYGKAQAYVNMSILCISWNKPEKARDLIQRALMVFEPTYPRETAYTLYHLARLHKETGNYKEALKSIEKAVEISKGLQGLVLNQGLKPFYTRSIQRYYDFLVDLLMEMHQREPEKGYSEQALNSSESLVSFNLLDFLLKSDIDIKSICPDIDDGDLKKLRLKKETAQAMFLTTDVMDINNTNQPNSQKGKDLETLNAKRLDAVYKYQEALQEVLNEASKCTKSDIQPLSLREIQKFIRTDTVLLKYSTTTDNAYLWLIQPNGFSSHQLGSSKKINDLVKSVFSLNKQYSELVERYYMYESFSKKCPEQYREYMKHQMRETTSRISSVNQKYYNISLELSDLLLRPVARSIRKQKIVIVADGILQYFPFAALLEPTEPRVYLVENKNHEISYLPSITSARLFSLRSEANNPLMSFVGIADPVYETQTQGNLPTTKDNKGAFLRSARMGNEKFRRIKSTEKVVLSVLSDLESTNKESFLQSKKFLNFDASKEQVLKKGALSGYKYIYFGTHAIANTLNPEFSGIVLSQYNQFGQPQDGFLYAKETYELNLSAELVVLQGCITVGVDAYEFASPNPKLPFSTLRTIKGEGLTGLTRGFIYSGANQVMVSLWSVYDTHSSELMTTFFNNLFKDKLATTPTKALQITQNEMLRKGDPILSSPFNWGSFIIQGQ